MDTQQHLEQIKQASAWAWQGDGSDHLESLSCPVLISPRDLQEIIARSKAH